MGFSIKDVDNLDLSDASSLLRTYHTDETNKEMRNLRLFGYEPSEIPEYKSPEPGKVTEEDAATYKNLFNDLLREGK